MSLLGLVLAAATTVAPLADSSQESRAQALEREIRCIVCENEPISQSTASLATDMRNVVRERIVAGDSDQEIREYFSARYGDFVLLRPPVNPHTWVLWLAPLALLLLGSALAFGLRRSEAERLEPEILPDDR